ncbi:MAG: rhomboid family intramembrane serine protease [Chitinophagales bacterium]|nr:rhomboid family intramembrane serine protease [Chitinophagales bacterium]MDW8419289.1 rhomboid family intramembrane serine protease [Chitinophagales bacterium]
MHITLFLVIVTSAISVLAFYNPQWVEKLIFHPYEIWRKNEWHRLVSCSFIHADWIHLIFNMLALYSFGVMVEDVFGALFPGFGVTLYVLMYFGAVALADIYNLFTRRNDYYYRSLGASGGVAAVIFASILFAPWSKIYLMFIPVGIPAFVFGPVYLAYCVYMAQRGGDHIAHTAHFTGAVFGFLFPLLLKPSLWGYFIRNIAGGL